MYNIKAACHRSSVQLSLLQMCTKLVLISSFCKCSWCLVKAGLLPVAIYPRQSAVSLTGRGRRAWIRGSPACRAASRSCRGRRWPCLSETPVRSWTPPRTGGPRCWRDTPDWRLRVPYRLNSLMRKEDKSWDQSGFQYSDYYS